MSVLESEDDDWCFRELLFDLRDLDLFVLYDFDLKGDVDCDFEFDDAWRLYLCTFGLLCFVLSLFVCLLWEDQDCELDDLEFDLDSDLECLYDLLCDFFFTIFESDFLESSWTDLDLEADLEELRNFFLGDFFTIFEWDFFLERCRTNLDLEADPEELGDLLTFDLEDLELVPFDGSAACDLDSASDLKISAASPVPFSFQSLKLSIYVCWTASICFLTYFSVHHETLAWNCITETSPYKSNPRFAPNI